MSDYLTKEDLRTILREELPPIVTSIVNPIVTDALKVNNEILVPMIMSMVKEEIIAIYDEFGKIHNKFEDIDKRFETMDKRLDAIDKDLHEIKENAKEFEDNITRQIAKIHSSLNMTLNYKPVIENIDQRLYLMEQQASYAKKKE